MAWYPEARPSLLASIDEHFLTVRELATQLRVSRKQIYKLIESGVLPAMRLGPRLYRIPVSAATRLLSDLRVEV